MAYKMRASRRQDPGLRGRKLKGQTTAEGHGFLGGAEELTGAVRLITVQAGGCWRKKLESTGI